MMLCCWRCVRVRAMATSASSFSSKTRPGSDCMYFSAGVSPFFGPQSCFWWSTQGGVCLRRPVPVRLEMKVMKGGTDAGRRVSSAKFQRIQTFQKFANQTQQFNSHTCLRLPHPHTPGPQHERAQQRTPCTACLRQVAVESPDVWKRGKRS